MASSDAFANEVVTLAATAGGSWWLGILESRPQDAAELAAAALTDVAPIAGVEITRTAGSWSLGSARQLHLAADVVMPASTGECSPAAWCLFADASLTTPVLCGWLADSQAGPLPTGAVLTLPASTVALVFPDRLAVLP